MRRSTDQAILATLTQLSSRLDAIDTRLNGRLDTLTTRMDTLIDAVAELRSDLLTHRHED